MNDFTEEIRNFLSRGRIFGFEIGELYFDIEYKDDMLCTKFFDLACDYDFSFDENLEELHEKLKEICIEDLKEELEELEKERDDYELTGDYRDDFEDSLDECTPPYEIGTLSYLASSVLRNCDPVAYKEELWAFEMQLDRTCEKDFCDILEKIDDKECEIESL